MCARMTHGRAIQPATLALLAVISLSMPACNAPDYKGMPIEQFQELVAQEEAEWHAQATSRPAGVPTTRPMATPPEYRVGPLDVLNVTVYGVDSLDAPTVIPARVAEDGCVTLPLVGAVSVADQSLAQIEKTIAAAYSPKYLRNPRVLVEMKEYHLTNVLVVGGIEGAREVPLRRNERTVFCSLAKGPSGGPGQIAQQVLVQPAADPYKLESYDLTQAGEVVRLMNRPPLEESDIVIARSAPPPAVYIFGLTGGGSYGTVGRGGGFRSGTATSSSFGTGGVFPIPETGLRLRQAIAGAGGVPTAFDADKIVLTRRMRSGQDVQVVFKWKELAVGNQPDVDLKPGDIIEIPHTAQTRIEEVLRNAVVLQAGVSAVWDPIAQFVPYNVRVSDGYNNGWNIRKLVLSDLALKAANKATSPILGP